MIRPPEWEAHSGLTGQPPETWETEHDAGCIYGGLSCGYWLIVDGCPEKHWEQHYAGPQERCSYGTLYPGSPNRRIIFDATDEREESSDG